MFVENIFGGSAVLGAAGAALLRHDSQDTTAPK